ncbi:hypothetical protein MtrunA17_Chr5g0420671 [Medicago truncatula]|uniref:Uncharacterized protein n=1 Tax=Medicago truncatula TaxID=3880 RepID=A0A396HY93_MEDTR|nr:hypothetical protein MtrunA17_Chr5g0420671 [Medicago truncatula]
MFLLLCISTGKKKVKFTKLSKSKIRAGSFQQGWFSTDSLIFNPIQILPEKEKSNVLTH